MVGDKIAIGSVEIISLVDVEIDHPLRLDRIFPEVPTAAWEPYRQRYPGAFGGPNVWRVQMGGYLLRSQGRTILVDTGLGPAGARGSSTATTASASSIDGPADRMRPAPRWRRRKLCSARWR